MEDFERQAHVRQAYRATALLDDPVAAPQLELSDVRGIYFFLIQRDVARVAVGAFASHFCEQMLPACPVARANQLYSGGGADSLRLPPDDVPALLKRVWGAWGLVDQHADAGVTSVNVCGLRGALVSSESCEVTL